MASSDSSDTETTDGENVFRPQSSREKRWGHKLDAGKVDQVNRPGESPTRQALDRELQTFISLRNKTDKATEVRPRPDLLWWSSEGARREMSFEPPR